MYESQKLPPMEQAMKVPAKHLENALADLAEWCGGSVSDDGQTPLIKVSTVEGSDQARPGDYIIKDVSGGYHVRTASQFAQAYPASVPTPPAPAHAPRF